MKQSKAKRTAPEKAKQTTLEKAKGSVPFASGAFVLGFLLLLVFFAPWGRGLYWPIGRVGFAILVLAVALGALLAAKKLVLSVADIAGVAMVALYAVGLITPASRYGALLGLITWAGYIGVYLLWRWLTPGDKERELLCFAVIGSVVVAALVGVLTYAGVVELQFQLAGDRIGAAFEYPNATASFFLLGIVLAVHRSHFATAVLVKRLLSVAAVLSVTGLVLTLSRGGWLAFVLFVPLMLWVGRRELLQVLYHFGMLSMLGVLGAAVLMAQKGPLGVVGALGFALLAFFAAKPPRAVYPVVRVVALVGLGIALVAVAVVVVTILAPPADSTGQTTLSRLVDRYVPDALAGRIAAFSFERLTADGRIVFFRDGVAIFRQAPLLGRGGGAWNAMYHEVQSFLYGTRRIHSDPYEIALEVGALGLLALLVVIGGALMSLRRANPSDASVALGLAAATMFAHSFIEALRAFPALYVIFFALLGAIPQGAPAFTLSPRALKAAKAFGAAICVAVMLLATGIFLAQVEASALGRAVHRGESVDAVAALRRIARLSPWDTEALTNLALQLWPLSQHRHEVESLLLRAYALEPHDPRVPNMLGQFRLQQGRNDDALAMFHEAVRRQPKNEQNYAMLAVAYADAALSAAGNPDRQRMLIEQVRQVESDFAAMAELAGPRARATGMAAPVMSENLRLAVAQAGFMAGDADAAAEIEQVLRTTGEESLRIMAAMWYERSLFLQGRTEEAAGVIAPFLEQPGVRDYRARLARLNP